MFRGLFSQLIPGGLALLSAEIINRGTACDPLEGLGRLNWDIFGSVGGAVVELAYNFGPTWIDITTSLDPSLTTYDFDISAEPGFISLENTFFRVRWTVGGGDLNGSPLFPLPPYACL